MAIQVFNSQECEWSDMAITLAGAPLGKIRSVQYTVEQDKAHLYGAGDEPISIQSGNRKYTGTIKVLKGAFDDINAAAIEAAGRDLLDLEFDIVVVYKAKGNRPLQTDTLVRCQVSSYNRNWDQGAKQMEISLPILFLQIKSN
ncbi:MAG TPA: hypothetical protein VN721_16655 [Flavipsychrobacter sp.]|nr:hypothetical protein [Flavipsychrobacter sp.]